MRGSPFYARRTLRTEKLQKKPEIGTPLQDTPKKITADRLPARNYSKKIPNSILPARDAPKKTRSVYPPQRILQNEPHREASRAGKSEQMFFSIFPRGNFKTILFFLFSVKCFYLVWNLTLHLKHKLI